MRAKSLGWAYAALLLALGGPSSPRRRGSSRTMPPRAWIPACAGMTANASPSSTGCASSPLQLPPLVEGLSLIALTFALCAIGHLLARQVPGLRLFLGIGKVALKPPQSRQFNPGSSP